MTTYLDIIPLQEAKDYLRVDGNDFDVIIELYIKSACRIFENKTEVALAEKDLDFKVGKRYYVDPISDETLVERKGLYFIPAQDITLTVGYADPLEVPGDIKQAILKMVEGMYWAEEKNEPFYISAFSNIVINNHKRFWI